MINNIIIKFSMCNTCVIIIFTIKINLFKYQRFKDGGCTKKKIPDRATLNLTNHIIISVRRFAWKSKAHPLWGDCTMARKARQAGYIKRLLIPRRHFQHQHQLLNDQRPNKSSQFCLDSSAIRPVSLCVYVRS